MTPKPNQKLKTAERRWKVMVIQSDKHILFQGEGPLVEDPEGAKWFCDLDAALEQVRDTAHLNSAGIVQFRLISEAW